MVESLREPPQTYRLPDAPWEECPKLTPENPRGIGIEHIIEIVSDDTRKETLPGNVVRHTLVRCRDCRYSWTFGVDK